MEGLVTLRNALAARHTEFFSRSWASLSADDAKRFSQLERDIMAVNAALGRAELRFSPDLEELLDRLTAAEASSAVDRNSEPVPAPPASTQRTPYRRS